MKKFADELANRDAVQHFYFPNVIGTIGCIHYAIVPGKIDEPLYTAVTYLGHHSTNLQTVRVTLQKY